MRTLFSKSHSFLSSGKLVPRKCQFRGSKRSYGRDVEKKGIVIGAYSTPCPGEYKLTDVGNKLNSMSGDSIMKYLKRVEFDKKPVLLLANVCADVEAVAVATLGPEDAGCSESECLDECRENARVAAGLGAMELQENDINTICVESFGLTTAAAEGASLATWTFQDLKDLESTTPCPELHLYDDPDADGWCRGVQMADAQNTSRKIEEVPANIMTAGVFSQTAISILCPIEVHVDVRDTAWVESKKMNGFLATAKGSGDSPLLLEMSYCGGGEGDKPVVLIGKGVGFDSGGLDLKSYERMVSDVSLGIAGAAVVVGVLKGLACLKVPININALIPLCFNMPGGQAMRPGDVFKAHNGKSVLIDRTDNEGEVVLADVLSFSEAYNPCLVISIAALCNSLRETLGAPASGVFSSTNCCWMEMARAAACTGDRVWRLPLWKAYTRYITEHQSVDVTNRGIYPGGDPCTAAAFLKEFAPCSDFVHLDISSTGGTTYDDSSPYLKKGLRTGRPTRTLIQFLYQLVCPSMCREGCDNRL